MSLFTDVQKVHRHRAAEGKQYTVHRIKKDGTPGPAERNTASSYKLDVFDRDEAHKLKDNWNKLNPGSKHVVKGPNGIEESYMTFRQFREHLQEAAGDEEYKQHRISQGISNERFEELARKRGAPPDAKYYHRDDHKTGEAGGWYQKHSAHWQQGNQLHHFDVGHMVAGSSGAYAHHHITNVSHTKSGMAKFKTASDNVKLSDIGMEDAANKL